jgi:hypothetical protein
MDATIDELTTTRPLQLLVSDRSHHLFQGKLSQKWGAAALVHSNLYYGTPSLKTYSMTAKKDKKKKTKTKKSSGAKTNNDKVDSVEQKRPAKRPRKEVTVAFSAREQGAVEPPLLVRPCTTNGERPPVPNHHRPHHHPFVTNVLDHCETPLRAYQHIATVLRMLAAGDGGGNKKKRQREDDSNKNNDFVIWDPYYCDGAAKRHLQSIGFDQVIHENVDFYATIGQCTIPRHDVFVTNPPYSDDHIDRLFRYLNGTVTATLESSSTTNDNGNDKSDEKKKKKPFCLLLPNWVARKSNYRELLSISNEVVYLSPVVPYTYQMPDWNHLSPPHDDDGDDATTTATTPVLLPEHVRQANGATTPYLSSWYIYGLSPAQFDELNRLSSTSDGGGSSSNDYDDDDYNQKKYASTSSSADWVVAKTIKGLKWKIQKKQQQQQQQNRQRQKTPTTGK